MQKNTGQYVIAICIIVIALASSCRQDPPCPPIHYNLTAEDSLWFPYIDIDTLQMISKSYDQLDTFYLIRQDTVISDVFAEDGSGCEDKLHERMRTTYVSLSGQKVEFEITSFGPENSSGTNITVEFDTSYFFFGTHKFKVVGQPSDPNAIFWFGEWYPSARVSNALSPKTRMYIFDKGDSSILGYYTQGLGFLGYATRDSAEYVKINAFK